MVLWHYGADVYYHGVKQDLSAKEADTDVSNIVGSSKVPRSRRLFSPEISPPTVRKPVVITPASVPATIPVQVPILTPVAESSDTRGKGTTDEPAHTESLKKITV